MMVCTRPPPSIEQASSTQAPSLSPHLECAGAMQQAHDGALEVDGESMCKSREGDGGEEGSRKEGVEARRGRGGPTPTILQLTSAKRLLLP